MARKARMGFPNLIYVGWGRHNMSGEMSPSVAKIRNTNWTALGPQ